MEINNLNFQTGAGEQKESSQLWRLCLYQAKHTPNPNDY